MASTIERLREAIDPQTVSNAIYNTMMSWIYSYTHLHANIDRDGAKWGNKNETRRLVVQVKVYEEVLASLLGVSKDDIRKFLLEHYDLKEIQHDRRQISAK